MGDLFYTIHWRSKLTGKTGAGSGAFTKAEANAIIEKMNIPGGPIVHWAEPVNPPAPLPQNKGKSDE